MPYVIMKQSPMYKQVSFDEILDGYVEPERFAPITNETATRTTYRVNLPDAFVNKFNIVGMVVALNKFNDTHAELFQANRSDLYHSFSIQKRSGGTRRIDAPEAELMNALRELKTIFENRFHAIYHTSAFAYIKGRCAVDAVKKHQANQSHWFLKTDFSNFFGSTTEDFVFCQLARIFPFSEVVKYPAGLSALQKALSLCFLNGGLPQGTPISPLLTNIMMIPIDHFLSNTLHDFEGQKFVYTRYADDILISSRIAFDQQKLVACINSTLEKFHAPFAIKDEKTRYGSGNGKNWNLGVMLNEKNQITIGHRRKQEFRAMLYEYIKTKQSGRAWNLHEVQVMDGLLSYYSSIEPSYWDAILTKYGEKFGCNVKRMIRADLR